MLHAFELLLAAPLWLAALIFLAQTDYVRDFERNAEKFTAASARERGD